MPFEGLEVTPAERVAREQKDEGRHLTGRKGRFSATLMTHNTQVALTHHRAGHNLRIRHRGGALL